jgi:2,3-bisphosphoglycerate-independent phosphoglycerate mutase
VATYDLQPEMSAPEVTAEVLRRLDTGIYDVIILNYANCDMVGHTGVFPAAVQAVETVDIAVGQVVDKVLDQDGIVLITADHGNAEQMIDPINGGAFTAHTSNPVLMIGAGIREGTLKEGRLCDIAPTILDLMGISIPGKMTGGSLLVRPTN